jgi:DNA-binding MarR family transcriptional regulator
MPKEELIQSIIENLAKCQRPGLNAAWKSLDLSQAQASVLYLLFYHEQASMKEVAEFLGISKSAVTQLLEPLVDKGFVKRQNDQNDRRIVRLNLTPKGSEVLKRLGKYKFAGLRSALENLSDQELEVLRKLHQKMADNLSLSTAPAK